MIEDIYKWLETAGVPQLKSEEQHNLCVSLIQEELDELIEAHKNKDPEGVKDAIVDLLWVTLNYPYMFDIPLVELQEKIDRVSYSNWTKFCATEAEAKKSVELYAKGEHPAKPGAKIDAYFHKSGEYWVVKRMSDSKILKSLEFIEP